MNVILRNKGNFLKESISVGSVKFLLSYSWVEYGNGNSEKFKESPCFQQLGIAMRMPWMLQDQRNMGTKMKERTPSQLHNYILNREACKTLRKFKGIESKTEDAKVIVRDTIRYFERMIEDNPVTINCKNASGMFTRLGRMEARAELRDWWYEESQALILEKIGILMLTHTHKCDSEELTNAIWGIGFLGPKVLSIPLRKPGKYERTFEYLVHDILNRIVTEMVRLRPIDLTSLVEGMARMQYKNLGYIMKAVTLEIKHKISRFKEIDLSRILWGLAHLGYPSRNGDDKDGLLSTLAWECKKRIGVFCSADLSRMIWVFGVLGFKDIQHMLWVVADQGIPGMKKIEPNHAVKFLWAFNALEHYPGQFALEQLSRHLSKGMHVLYPSDIMSATLALANLGVPDDRVPVCLKDLIKNSVLKDLTPREAANFGWILATTDCLDHDVFMILRRYLTKFSPELLPLKHKAEIYRLVPEALAKSCYEGWIKEQQDLVYSPIMTEVLEILRSEGYHTKVDDLVHKGILIICSAIPKNNIDTSSSTSSSLSSSQEVEQKYAVEVIAPPKCFRNDHNTISGSQVWRENLLVSWGWKVLRVEEKRWNRIKDDREKAEYLKLLVRREEGFEKLEA